MYSNEELERFYFQYQTEAVPSGEFIQSFCKRNNVPYNIFSIWYTNMRGPINYSDDMSSDQKDRYIRYLVDRVNELNLDKCASLPWREFQGVYDKVVESLARLQCEVEGIKGELSAERSKRKAAESRKLEQQLRFAQKNLYRDEQHDGCCVP